MTHAPIGALPLWAQERLFEDRTAAERRKQDAIDALDYLQTLGVVNAPGLFWWNGCGETLLERLKRMHAEKIFAAYSELHNWTGVVKDPIKL